MNCKAPISGLEAEEYIEKTLGFSLEVLESFPKYFLIESINACNARCIMCGVDFNSKKNGIISDYLFEKITKEISQYSDHVEKVMLYLDGEPLLDKNIHIRIQKMKIAGIKKVNIATNGSLLNEDRTIQLIEAGLDEIYITLDSLKKDVYETIRVGLSFETVYNNITEFIRIRNRLNPELAIRLQMVLQELNYNEVVDFNQHWKKLLNQNDQVVIQKCHNWASAINTMKFGDEDTINSVPCIALWGTFVLHLNGEAPLCCMDTKNSVVIGDFNSQTIAQIWKGETLNEIREKHIKGKRSKIPVCDGCTLWRESKKQTELPIGTN